MVGNVCRPPESCPPMWVYHRLPTRPTKPKSKWPCMRFPLPNITGSCARGAKPRGGFGLVYQLLPTSGSGSAPTVCDLYQQLPPRPRTGDRCECSRRRGCHVGSRVEGYRCIERWHTVGHSGEPYTHSERVTRWHTGLVGIGNEKEKKI
jgi:hypothetical protein